MKTAVICAIMLLGFSARGIAQTKSDSTAGRFTLIGVVRDTVGMPLSGAEVSAEGLSTLTDEKGEFALHGLPVGTVQLTIHRIGYRAVSVGLVAKPDTRGVSIAAKMTPNETTLGTVVIEGKKVDLALFQNGFYTRQKTADGYFFPPERLEKTAASMSTMMNEIPSVKVAYSHGAAIPMAVGGHGMNGPIYCRMNVFLDGTYVPWAKSDGLDAVIAEQDVKAIEVYTRPESVPNTIRGVAGAQSVASQVTTGGRGLGAGSVNCGAILIWSKLPAEESATK